VDPDGVRASDWLPLGGASTVDTAYALFMAGTVGAARFSRGVGTRREYVLASPWRARWPKNCLPLCSNFAMRANRCRSRQCAMSLDDIDPRVCTGSCD